MFGKQNIEGVYKELFEPPLAYFVPTILDGITGTGDRATNAM